MLLRISKSPGEPETQVSRIHARMHAQEIQPVSIPQASSDALVNRINGSEIFNHWKAAVRSLSLAMMPYCESNGRSIPHRKAGLQRFKDPGAPLSMLIIILIIFSAHVMKQRGDMAIPLQQNIIPELSQADPATIPKNSDDVRPAMITKARIDHGTTSKLLHLTHNLINHLTRKEMPADLKTLLKETRRGSEGITLLPFKRRQRQSDPSAGYG